MKPDAPCDGPWDLHLSRLDLGDPLDPDDAAALSAHLQTCARCQQVQAEHAQLSRLLDAHAQRPPQLAAPAAASALRAVHAALARERSPDPAPEIMTLDEVAALLRVSRDDLDLELHSLPVFEFAGQLRVRRARLMAWIEAREQQARHRLALVGT